eukprot:TRINITY_DN7129_c0_g1_i3.p1 TRINITY_DN7129_c0_g1~~TRINITY_DN7129_c0_g1_i3.p1  ORF type:complete len:245 (+),score=44.33 TRINITY_DN7129_c0_g1_i3:239-973(+)
MEQALRWPFDQVSQPDPRLCHDEKHHFLIPALFHTITELKARGREFTVVIRTFGTDVDDVVAALNAYAEGKHVIDSPGPEATISPESVYRGRYQQDGSFVLSQVTEGGVSIADENLAVKTLEGANQGAVTVCAIQDDYDWWSQHQCTPSSGKPLWLTRDDRSCHHIFFDDNIHNLVDDSIVAVRARDDESCKFVPLSGEDTLALAGVHLVRVPTIEPILNPNYFLERIEECEAAKQALVERCDQ